MEINKLIDALRVCADDDIICPACERYDKIGVMGGTADCVSKLLLEAAAGLEEQRKRIAELEEQRRWIPVTERLPDKDGFYIVVMNGDIWGEPDVWSSTACGFYDGRWDEDGATISHWMPLPEPPKGE